MTFLFICRILFINGEARSNLIGRRSSKMGVVSSEVIWSLPLRLIVGLSTNDKELHSSDVGDTRGVKVVGVTLPGLKNWSRPSPISLVPEPSTVTRGRVGARVLARLGLPLTKCCSWNEALGNSVMESQPSSAPISSMILLPAVRSVVVPLLRAKEMSRCEICDVERCEEGDSRRSGMWPKLRFSTTDWGRTLRAIDRRLLWKCGVA